jgi:tripartite-type tricarboxylate transporter receptor subunit TctC
MPTLVESGIAFDAVGWHAVFVPVGTPVPVVNRLNAAFNKAMDQPKVIERIINGGSIPAEKGVTPSQWTAQYEKETKQWAEIAKAVNAKLE